MEMARASSDTTSSRIAVLEDQVQTIHTDVEHLEKKMDENYATLHGRISGLRDDLQASMDTKHEKIIEKIDANARNSSEQHKQLYDKISTIEKWRWMIMGGAIVLGYVLAHIKMEKLF